MAGAGAGNTNAVATVEEDASELAFPKEFENEETKTLLVSEVREVITNRG